MTLPQSNHGRQLHREGMYIGHFSYVALICSNITPICRQDGQAEDIRYLLRYSLILLSVMQQLLTVYQR